jgi:hypothetical protein
MYRVCRDPLLHVQARLWPPDVLFWEFFFAPKISKKMWESRKHQHQNGVALSVNGAFDKKNFEEKSVM